MPSSYGAVSGVYDRYTKNVDYKRYSKLIAKTLKENIIEGIVLDAGCGTGTMTLLLAKLGFDMIGADVSEEMLAIASEKAFLAKAEIPFLRQELTKLDLYGTVKVVVSTLDTLNHLESKAKLKAAISRFSLFTEAEGLLIFDMNTPYKHKNVLADNAFFFDDGEIMLVWQNEYDEKKRRVKITTDVFSPEDDGLYARESDEFFEYDYEIKEVEEILSECGYALLSKSDFNTLLPPTEKTERVLFIAKKVVEA